MAKVIFISTPFENLGIEYLSASLKQNGHTADLIIDPCLFSDCYEKNDYLSRIFSYRKDVLSQAKAGDPDLIAFSVMTDTYQWALSLAKLIKNELSKPIIFGGIHPTLLPEIVISNDVVDFLCVGEGEESLVQLANSIDRKQSADFNIQNIWYKQNGLIKKNPLRPLIMDLDRLPLPDKELYYRKNNVYQRQYFAMTGRGCDYSCFYCCNQAIKDIYDEGYIRKRDVAGVIRELAYNKTRYDFDFTWFMDDNFASNTEWLKSFIESYKKFINVPFFCYVHPNNISSEVVDLLQEGNCHELAMGVQTLNDETCKLINRESDKVSVKKAINIVNRTKIISITENILGLPGESEVDIITLSEFYNKNRPFLILYDWLKIFPKTELLKKLQKMQLINGEKVNLINQGVDKSLSMGGNYAAMGEFNKSAVLLSLVQFLPVASIDFILKHKIYRYFHINSNFIQCVIRFFKTTKIAKLLYGKCTYDAGMKIGFGIYVYYVLKKLKMKVCFRKNAYGEDRTID